MVRPPNIL